MRSWFLITVHQLSGGREAWEPSYAYSGQKALEEQRTAWAKMERAPWVGGQVVQRQEDRKLLGGLKGEQLWDSITQPFPCRHGVLGDSMLT